MVVIHCPCDTVVRMRADDDDYNLVEGKGAWVACFHHAFSLICNTVYSNKDRNVSAFVAVFWGSKVFIFWWEDISNKFWSGSVSRLVSIFVVQIFHLVQLKLRDWVTNLAPKHRPIRGQSSFHRALLAMATCFDCLVRYCIIGTSRSSVKLPVTQTWVPMVIVKCISRPAHFLVFIESIALPLSTHNVFVASVYTKIPTVIVQSTNMT